MNKVMKDYNKFLVSCFRYSGIFLGFILALVLVVYGLIYVAGLLWY